ncbi:MAG: Lsr2 family protein [Actinomycetota bacterium]|nr:Lsr2 family protein [Actinomycetota bacterium]
MAQRVVVLFQDDLDNSEATHTIQFGVDDIDHEIDLNDHHAQQLRDAFAPWIAVARTTRSARPARRNSPSQHPAARVDPEQLRTIRAWGREHGYTLNNKGRIPQTVQDAYHQAH